MVGLLRDAAQPDAVVPEAVLLQAPSRSGGRAHREVDPDGQVHSSSFRPAALCAMAVGGF